MAKLTEKQFLIGLALRYFNDQYTKTIQIDDCVIASISTRYGFERSYQIETTRLDDNVRLHMHIRFEGLDGLSKYRVEVDSELTRLIGSEGSLNDEVYVTTGTIDPYYRDKNVYKFLYIDDSPASDDFILLEDGSPLLYESGGPIELEPY